MESAQLAKLLGSEASHLPFLLTRVPSPGPMTGMQESFENYKHSYKLKEMDSRADLGSADAGFVHATGNEHIISDYLGVEAFKSHLWLPSMRHVSW